MVIHTNDSSETVAEQFTKINIYSKCDWYLFSSTVQRILPLFIANSDVAVVKGFGNVFFTRELLKRLNLKSKQWHTK